MHAPIEVTKGFRYKINDPHVKAKVQSFKVLCRRQSGIFTGNYMNCCSHSLHSMHTEVVCVTSVKVTGHSRVHVDKKTMHMT